MLICRDPCGFPVVCVMVNSHWSSPDRPERAKWTHSKIRSYVETRDANAKTEKGEEEKAKRGE